MLSRDEAFNNIIEESTSHCKTDQAANRTYSLPLIMTEKKEEIFMKISALQHTFFLQKIHVLNKKKIPNQNTVMGFFNKWVF